MIDRVTFTKEWLDDRSIYFGKGKSKGNKELIEKVINAMYLLEKLVSNGLNLIFKGGTSLILLLEDVHRFSIDIDIVIDDQEDLERIFSRVIKDNYIFNNYQKEHRKNASELSKEHYKFYFTSILDGTIKYILLDILYEDNPYTETMIRPIESVFFRTIGESVGVLTPSIDCILGDKLTAFAPNTTGIPYNADKELEIIKQLFDVSNLFDKCTDIHKVKGTFTRIAQNELKYRKMNDVTTQDVLLDIYDTSFIIAMRGAYGKEEFTQLEKGMKRIKSHIFSQKFNIEDAVLCSSKAAYCSMLLAHGTSDIERFDKAVDLRNEAIELDGFTKYFKSLKKITPEGYFYWMKAVELRKRIFS